MTERIETLEFNLTTKEETKQGIESLQQHYSTIRNFVFLPTKQAQNNGTTTTTTTASCAMQQNFTKFLVALAEISKQAYYWHTRTFHFDNQSIVIGINEAKILAQFIKATNPAIVNLVFNCQVSNNAFQYLISECGDKKSQSRKYRKPRPQKRRFFINGTAIQHYHIKSLDQVLITSNIGYLNLQGVNLQKGCLDDDCAIELGNILIHNTLLSCLSLNDNKIGIVGAQALANMIRDNTCLEMLNLSENCNIGDDGVTAIAQSLLLNKSLKKLMLSNVGCGNQGLIALASSLTTNNGLADLDLSKNNNFNSDITLEDLQILENGIKCNSTLTSLDLGEISSSFADRIGPTLASSVAGKKSKFELRLRSIRDIGDNIMNAFAQCRSPQLTLDFTYCHLDDSHFEALANGIQEGTFDVQSLLLGSSEADDDFIMLLFDALVEKKSSCSLIELNLEHAEGITVEGAQYIVDNIPLTKIEKLFLTAMPIGDEGVQQIASYINDTQLTELCLDGVGMKDSGLIALATVLKSNTKLTDLDFYNSDEITIVGKQALLDTMKYYNRTLTCILQEDHDDADKAICDEIDFYEDLNKAKRDNFYDSNNIPIALYADILEDYNGVPSVIYWILQVSLHLFSDC